MNLRKRTLLVASIPCMLLPVAHAQNADPQSAATQMDEVLVTGSRLATTGLDTSAPVTILDRSEIDATGATSVGELLRELPVATASASDTAGRGNAGSATVALRGLSAVNTLVLINGRRVLSNNDGGTVDLNSIPFEAVDRVEVLQDGASAIYGSDAIAGVVNIIMRREFDGLSLKGGYGVSSRDDVPNTELSATFGHNADKGGFVFNASWREAEGNFIADRPVSRDPDWRAQGGRNFRDPLPTVAVVQGLPGFGNAERILLEGVNQAATVNDFRAFVFPDTNDPLSVGNDGINYWLYETSASDIRQQNVSFTGDYELTSQLTAFVEASFNRRRSTGYLAPDYFGAVYGDPIILSANNDFNPFGVDLSVARTIGEQPLPWTAAVRCHLRCVAHGRRRRRKHRRLEVGPVVQPPESRSAHLRRRRRAARSAAAGSRRFRRLPRGRQWLRAHQSARRRGHHHARDARLHLRRLEYHGEIAHAVRGRELQRRPVQPAGR